jgi:solute:Na+ symporter, SSS family
VTGKAQTKVISTMDAFITRIDTLDLAVIGAYFLIVFAIGAYLARRTHSADDLFLAGRRLGWLPIGFSLFASNISSTTLIGLMGAAYTWGIAVANYEWMAAPLLVVFSPCYSSRSICGAASARCPSIWSDASTGAPRRYFSALTLVSNIVVDTAGTLFAGAIVLATFYPRSGHLHGRVDPRRHRRDLHRRRRTGRRGLHRRASGDRPADRGIARDLFQPAGDRFRLGPRGGRNPSRPAQPVLPMSDPNLPWLGVVVGMPVLGFYFWCTNQFVVQRVLGARDIENARWGALLAGFLKLSVLFIMVIPGVIAILIIPGLGASRSGLPALIAELLPAGVRGLVLAALGCGPDVEHRLDAQLGRDAPDAGLHQAAASQLDATPDGLDRPYRHPVFYADLGCRGPLDRWIRRALSLSADRPVVFGPAGGGALFARSALGTSRTARRTGDPARRTRRLGSAVCADHRGRTDLHFTLVAGILFAVSAAIFVVAGLSESAPSAARAGAVAEMVWRPHSRARRDRVAWWSDYRLQSAGIAGADGGCWSSGSDEHGNRNPHHAETPGGKRGERRDCAIEGDSELAVFRAGTSRLHAFPKTMAE